MLAGEDGLGGIQFGDFEPLSSSPISRSRPSCSTAACARASPPSASPSARPRRSPPGGPRDGGDGRCFRHLAARCRLALWPAAGRHRRLDRCRGGVRPAAREQRAHQSTRARNPRDRIRHERSDGHFPGGGADRRLRPRRRARLVAVRPGTLCPARRRRRGRSRRRLPARYRGRPLAPGRRPLRTAHRRRWPARVRRGELATRQRLPRHLSGRLGDRLSTHPRDGARQGRDGRSRLGRPGGDVPHPRPAGHALAPARQRTGRARYRAVPDFRGPPARRRVHPQALALSVEGDRLRGLARVARGRTHRARGVPVVHGLPDAKALFDVTFTVVLVSLVLQGTTVARRRACSA